MFTSPPFFETSIQFEYFQKLLKILKHISSKDTALPFADLEEWAKGCSEISNSLMKDQTPLKEYYSQQTNDILELVNNLVEKHVNQNSLHDEKTFTNHCYERETKNYFDFIKDFYEISTKNILELVEKANEKSNHNKHGPYFNFLVKQFTQAVNPQNFAFTNAKVMKQIDITNGKCLLEGLDNFYNDLVSNKHLFNVKTASKNAFEIGKNIATTTGKIIHKNLLCELIHYKPQKQTHEYPILICPPWINKFYILDLQDKNSFIKWLIQNNYDVFLISWVNPNQSHKNIEFQDYLKLGILDSLDFMKDKYKYTKVNLMGYCIGGTLSAIALSYLQQKNNNIINSCTLLTTMLDFSDPGELGHFINESTKNYLTIRSCENGFIDASYFQQAFSLLRSSDMIWHNYVNNYLLGQQPKDFDLLYWNSDSTNMPIKTCMYYLTNFYQNNILAAKKTELKILGEKIKLNSIKVPIFFLATQGDHITPWKSVYEGAKLISGKITFCLAESGHIAGVINPPENKKYSHWLNNSLEETSDRWFQNSSRKLGSWWETWNQWQQKYSGALIDNKLYNSRGTPMAPAPGEYVKCRYDD